MTNSDPVVIVGAVTLLLGAWAAYHPAATVATTEDLPQNFENTLLASVDPSDQAQCTTGKSFWRPC